MVNDIELKCHAGGVTQDVAIAVIAVFDAAHPVNKAADENAPPHKASIPKPINAHCQPFNLCPLGSTYISGLFLS